MASKGKKGGDGGDGDFFLDKAAAQELLAGVGREGLIASLQVSSMLDSAAVCMTFLVIGWQSFTVNIFILG